VSFEFTAVAFELRTLPNDAPPVATATWVVKFELMQLATFPTLKLLLTLHGLPAETASNWLDVSFTGSPAIATAVIAPNASAESMSFFILILHVKGSLALL
jgi:hypothetical protein